MDLYKDGVICTKNKLWKKKQTIVDIVEEMVSLGYTFKEMVYGEPNDFVFATKVEDILPKLSIKGTFFGIRLKFTYRDAALTITSNTRGVDNVKYQIFADDRDTLQKVENEAMALKSIIGPSSSSTAKLTEYISTHRKLRTALLVILAVAGVFLVNTVFPVIDIVYSIFMFAPILFILIFISYIRRR